LLRQRKKAKKATAQPLALRVSRLCKSKNGKRTKLAFGSDNVHFFIHFLLRTNGSVTAGEIQNQLPETIQEQQQPGYPRQLSIIEEKTISVITRSQQDRETSLKASISSCIT